MIESRAAIVRMQKELAARRKALIVEKLAAMKARTIEMLRLFDDEGLTYNAVAIILEMSPHTVKCRLARRGRSIRLRQMMRAQDKADRINAGEAA